MGDWVSAVSLLFGGVIFLIVLGFPVMIAFIAANFLGAIVFFGGEIGIHQMLPNMRPAVAQYALVPVPFFVLMGEIMLQSGLATRAIDALDKAIARMPGRLSVVSVMGGVSFAALSGSSVANAAVVGRSLLPQMRARGYDNVIAIGPVAAVGGIAALIPPSAMAVMLGSLARVSINDLLIAGIVPGLMMMAFFRAYILIRCALNPALAPAYEVQGLSAKERFLPLFPDVLPLMLIFLAVIGNMLAGIATPKESAAIGTIASVIAGICYRCMSWSALRRALLETVKFSAMILLIICSSGAFSQILSFTGATQAITRVVVEGSGLPPLAIVALMLVVLLVLGCFMESASIMMLSVPIFFPILTMLQLDPLWFGLMMLIALEIGLCTPPFGMLLFVVKGVIGPGVPMTAIYRSVLPYIGLQMAVLVCIFLLPGLVGWLPALMH